MELRQLRMFIAVAEELHFRHAAERVGLAQTALSAQIRGLEQELGFPLLFRTTRHVSLTQAGAVFLDEARAVIGRAEEAVEVARAASQSGLKRLRVGGIDAALVWFLPPVLSAFRASFPSVLVPLTEVSASAEQVFELLRHHVDIAFFRPPVPVDGVAWELLFEERVLAAVPTGHRLAQAESVSVADLADEPLIGYPRHARPLLHAMLWEGFARAGLRPRIEFEAMEKSTLLRLVGQGAGIGLVPQWVSLLPQEGVVFRPYDGSSASMGFAVGWRQSDRSETLSQFVRLAKDHAAIVRQALAVIPGPRHD